MLVSNSERSACLWPCFLDVGLAFCLKWSLKFVILPKRTSGQYSKFKGVNCASVCFLVLIAQTTDWVSCREKGSTALVQGQEATSATGLLAG